MRWFTSFSGHPPTFLGDRYERCKRAVSRREDQDACKEALRYIEACIKCAAVDGLASAYAWKGHVLVCLGRVKEARVAYRLAKTLAGRYRCDGADLYARLASETPADADELQAVMSDERCVQPPQEKP
jgi:hypothetical protein